MTSNAKIDDFTVSYRSGLSRLSEMVNWKGWLLALLPVVSFFLQYRFSVQIGTQRLFLHHPDVAFADWIFVPFNYFAARVIEWRSGWRLYVISVISVIGAAWSHAFWEYNHLDPGHMIAKNGIVLPAGWVHVAFSTAEATLLMAFVFCRNQNTRGVKLGTALAVAYFVALGAGSYVLHGNILVSDLVTVAIGLFFLLIFPSLISKTKRIL